jgi:hypothetical protein
MSGGNVFHVGRLILPRTALKKLTLGASLAFLLATGAQAESCYRPLRPDYNWTVRMEGRYYGLIGYGSTTHVVFGQRSFSIPLHVFAVTGAVALSVTGLGFLGFRGAIKGKTES